MKSFIKIVCITLFIALLLPLTLSTASFEDYKDVDGHWAQTTLRQAYNAGLIDGYNGYLFPDQSITTAQALTILCRVFGAKTEADISHLDISGNKWYTQYVAQAVYFGLISSVAENTINAPMTRQDAFYLIAEAFQLIDPDPDISVLKSFSDAGQIRNENRKALASLNSRGLIVGYNGKLDVNAPITRAAFVTVIFRIIKKFVPASSVDKTYDYGVILQGSADLSSGAFSDTVWFDCSAENIRLNNVNAAGAVIRSNNLVSLTIGGSSRINRLTLAAQAGTITVSPEGSAVVDKLIVGSGGGEVSVKKIDAIEVAGHNRSITIEGNADFVAVSGRNCTIRISNGARVRNIILNTSADDCRVEVEGTVSYLEVKSYGAAINGKGSIETLVLYRSDTKVNESPKKIDKKIDPGLTGAEVRIDTQKSLPVNTTLTAAAIIENAEPGSKCDLIWFVDGVEVSNSKITTGEAIPVLTCNYTYSRIMPETSTIKVSVRYVTLLGEQQEISAESTVSIQNYDKKYWMKLEEPRVLEKVKIGYLGDYTTEWALANDHDDFDKEVWINAKGYTSRTEYLLWINLAYQRVNIFRRVNGSWELIRVCLVATGAPGRGTALGVCTTTYKLQSGWNTASYTCKPVVGFREGTGYAFHSRLYYPNSTVLKDPSIGFPVSLGCIRMYDEDIWYIYDYIPLGTTVVVH